MTDATTNQAPDTTAQAPGNPAGSTPAGQPAGSNPAAQSTTASATQAPDATPVAYEFKAPEGIALGDALDKAKAFASSNKLSAEAAQQLVDFSAELARGHAQAESTKLQDQIKAQVQQWVDTAKADKELGGAKFEENVGIAEKALATYGSDGLREVLTKSGLSNHPEIIRAFWKIGQTLQEDKMLGDRAAGEVPSLASRLYGKKAA